MVRAVPAFRNQPCGPLSHTGAASSAFNAVTGSPQPRRRRGIQSGSCAHHVRVRAASPSPAPAPPGPASPPPPSPSPPAAAIAAASASAASSSSSPSWTPSRPVSRRRDATIGGIGVCWARRSEVCVCVWGGRCAQRYSGRDR